MSDSERRQGTRYRVRFLIMLEREDEGTWHVMSRDMSRTGAMFAASPELDVGERVKLTFTGEPFANETYEISGTIVRADHFAEGRYAMWPDQVAVEFEDPVPELEDFLKDSAELLDKKYPSTPPPPKFGA